MGYVGNQTSTSYTSMDKQTITGSGATAYTLSHSVSSESEIEVFVNNIRQEGGSGKAYTVSGTTITFTEAITSSDECYVIFQGKAIQTVVPPDGSVTSAKLATNIQADTLYGKTTDGDSGIDLATNDIVKVKIAGSEKARVDASGNLVLGDTSASAKLDVNVNSSTAYSSTGEPREDVIIHNVNGTDDTGTNNYASLGFHVADGATSQGFLNYVRTGNNVGKFTLSQRTAGSTYTEHLNIDKDGTSTFNCSDVANVAMIINNNGASGTPEIMLMDTPNYSKDSTGGHFLKCDDSTATRMVIDMNGSLRNHDNSYGSLSDERIKQDISDASSQWDDIKAVKVRKYKKKDDVAQYKDKAWEQIGVVAQELEASGMDKLVDIDNESEEKWKSVKYSVLYMKAIKALQEAMIRIETLETKVKALEGK